jgi:hypothetical protein
MKLVFVGTTYIFCLFLQAYFLREADYTTANAIFKILNGSKDLGSGSLILDKLIWLIVYCLDALFFGHFYNIFAPLADVFLFFRPENATAQIRAVIGSGSMNTAIVGFISTIYLFLKGSL